MNQELLGTLAKCIKLVLMTWESAGAGPILKVLDRFGGFPIISENWNENDFDWLKVLALFHKKYGVIRFISVLIGQDEKNSSFKALYLNQGELVASRVLLAYNDTVTRKKVISIMRNVVDLLIRESRGKINPEKVTTEPSKPTKIPEEMMTTTTSAILMDKNLTVLPDTIVSSNSSNESSSTAPNEEVIISGSLNVSPSNSSGFSPASTGKLFSNSQTSTGNFFGQSRSNVFLHSILNYYSSVEEDFRKFSEHLKPAMNDDVISLIQMEKLAPKSVEEPVKPEIISESLESIQNDLEDVWNFFVEVAQIMENTLYANR
ncbi:hypothetical protein Avbf_17363 [Armadillidium vulgare]|nr:hypothetical protein Avbf_17363 [Armadillidium vulgare]